MSAKVMLSKGKSRYFRRSLLSEAKFRLIMRYFTHDLPASEEHRKGRERKAERKCGAPR